MNLLGNSSLLVKSKDGTPMKEPEALHSLSGMKKPKLPMGKPLFTDLPPEIVDDTIQVLEFFGRFTEILDLNNDAFSMKQFEGELCYQMVGEFSTNNALSAAHMSILKVLISELQAKVGVKRGRKRNLDSVQKSKKMLPLNELTWPELTRRYLLSMLSIADNTDALHSGKVSRCLVGDGGVLCGSLIGVVSIEADALLLAQAMHKVLGSMDREYDVLTVADGEASQLSACSSNHSPEWAGEASQLNACPSNHSSKWAGEASQLNACPSNHSSKWAGEASQLYAGPSNRSSEWAGEASQLSAGPSNHIPEWVTVLEPVRKLPTNVGSRIRNCVRAALEKDPPEWAKEKLEHSISKEVYKGNASGPTKRDVLLVLATVCGEEVGKKSVKERKKPNEKRKGRKYASISNIIMKQCRITLRNVANLDDNKLLCNLLGSRVANSSERGNEGILGSPANVSRPLDFRTIDLRLAAGAYDGLHEAFREDVQEFWNHVRISCEEKPHLKKLADKLSSIFDELYEKEILASYKKLMGYARLGCLTAEAKKEVDEFIVSSGVLPQAPWESGICKICAINKNDGLVLLCDTCDAEYHTYCLNPPLVEVPPGNWHCPSCVSETNGNKGSSEEGNSASYDSSRESMEEYTLLLTQLVSFLGDKDYWDHSPKERTLLLRYISDEWLNSASAHSHLDHCIKSVAETEQKLRSAYVDLEKKKHREELLAENVKTRSEGSLVEVSEMYENTSSLDPVEINMNNSPDSSTELNSVRKSIKDAWVSVSKLEMQLMNLSGRKEFLGSDSPIEVAADPRDQQTRLFWVSANPSQKLSIIVNDTDIAADFPWILYQSLTEIKELVEILRDDDPGERKLKESISGRLKLNLQDAEYEGFEKTESALSGRSYLDSELLATRAAGVLMKAYGLCFDLEDILHNKQWKKGQQINIISDDKFFRCKDCLQPILPLRHHCLSCHKTFLTKRESAGHNDNQCESGLAGSSVCHENGGFICPNNSGNICYKLVMMDSMKDLVKEVSLLGSNGVPLFLPPVSPYPNNPALQLNGSGNDEHVPNESIGTHGASKPENMNVDKKDQNSSFENCGGFSKPSVKLLLGNNGVLDKLKMNLLDMEAALPKSAIRPSKTCIKRRWAWRSFVHRALTIDEMVQAIIVFEDMIKPDNLNNEWWYWSSLSAAANISTLSALALRIYSLDASIVY